MDINFQTHTHYVFPLMDRSNILRLETLRYAPDGQGGNVFGAPDILRSLAVYGIQHHVAVKAETKDMAIRQAAHQGLTLDAARILNYVDEQKFAEAYEQYGSLDDILHTNHTYKIELRRAGYTVGEQLQDVQPGENYHRIGEVFSVPHPYDKDEQAKGILYHVPTWTEVAFGRHRHFSSNTAVICLSDGDFSNPDSYLIVSPDEFDTLFRANANGIRTADSGFRDKHFYALINN